MKKHFKLILVIMAAISLLMLLTLGCVPASGDDDSGDDDSGGSTSSLAIMPTAVFSTSPEVSTAKSIAVFNPFASFFDNATRADAGILEPEKLTPLFMPLFTGLKVPDSSEVSNNLSADWVGYYMKTPVLLEVIDKTAENTDDKYIYKMGFDYWQDTDKNKKIDYKVDKWVATVNVKSAFKDFSDVKWELNQEITNPFDITQKYSLIASGISDSEDFSGSGTFTAQSGDYKGSATISWSKNKTNGKKYIKVEDGYIKYTGSATTDYFNVSDLSITIDVSSDGTSKVIESSKVVSKDATGIVTEIVKQATTRNDIKGNPTDVAYTISIKVKGIDGTITSSDTLSGAYKIDENLAITTTTAEDLSMADLFYADEDATPAKVKVVITNCPTDAMGKPIKLTIVRPDYMIFDSNGEYPDLNKTHVATMNGAVSSSYSASFTTANTIDPGFYICYASIDMNYDDTTSVTSFVDNYCIIGYGTIVDGRKGDPIVVNLGNVSMGEPGWSIFGQSMTDLRQKLPIKASLKLKDGTLLSASIIKDKLLFVGLFENIPIGINWNYPIGSAYLYVTQADIDKGYIEGNLYLDIPIDLNETNIANKKYVLAGRIDVNNDGLMSKNDYWYNDLYWEDGQPNPNRVIILESYEYKIDLPGFLLQDTEPGNMGTDYSIFGIDGVPPTTNPCYDASGITISGYIDASILGQGQNWYAHIMQRVADIQPQPVAFAQVDANGNFSFSNIKSGFDYDVMAIAYNSFDPSYEDLRMPYNYEMVALQVNTTTGYPQTYEVIMPTTNVTGIKLDSWLFFGDFMTMVSSHNDTLNLSEDGLNVIEVNIKFYDSQDIPMTPPPSYLDGYKFDIIIEQQDGAVWKPVPIGVYRGFNDPTGAFNDWITLRFEKAKVGAIYRFTVSFNAWDWVNQKDVYIFGQVQTGVVAGDMTPSTGNGVEMAIKEDTFTSEDVDLDVYIDCNNIVMTEPSMATQLPDKLVWIELLDYNYNRIAIKSATITDTDGNFSASTTMTNIPKNNYMFRAFIDMDGSTYGVETTEANAQPDNNDIQPNLQYNGEVYMYNAPYYHWFGDWIGYGNGGGGTGTIGEISIYHPSIGAENGYIRITDLSSTVVEPSDGNYSQFMFNAGSGYWKMMENVYTEGTEYQIDLFIDMNSNAAFDAGDYYYNGPSFIYGLGCSVPLTEAQFIQM